MTESIESVALCRRDLIRLAGAGSAALALSMTGRGSKGAFAQQATPPAAGTPVAGLPDGCRLVAGNLKNPRFLALDKRGNIYVTEAGDGGTEEVVAAATPISAPAEGQATPAPGASLGTRGETGQVSRIAADGQVTVVARGLASYNVEGPVGPAGIVASGDRILVAVGGAGPATAFVDPLETENSVLSIDPQTGSSTKLADIGAYERENNPDAYAIDSNCYGMVFGSDDMLYVADAGGNSVYAVDPANGDIRLRSVIPGLPYPSSMEAPPGGNPARGGANRLDPVPTGVAFDPNGRLVVSLLSGAPFPPGAARVIAVALDGSLTTIASGLTMATDAVIGPDGDLYVCQISMDFGGQQPAPGSVVRVLDDGTFEPVVEGIMLPNGIAFDQDGNLYIAAGSISTGSQGGMVLRCDGVAHQAPGSDT